MTRRAYLTILAVAALIAASLVAAKAGAGGGGPPVGATTAPAPNPPSITALGAANVRVAPAARNDRAISRVVAAAHARAVPAAFAAARVEAGRQAAAAGVEVGPVQQVAPAPIAAYGSWWGAPSQGTYGFNRWCANARIHRRGTSVRRFRCQRPHFEAVTLSVTFDLRRP
jgi:hypothetical protein